MDIQGIDVVFYHANDMAESLTWYRDVLGLHHVADYGDWQEFDLAGARFGVDAGNTATEIPNAVVSFRVDDLDAALAELAERGVKPASDVIDIGHTRFVAVCDPSGNLVQLSQPRT